MLGLIVKNIRLKDLSHVVPLALLFKRIPSIAEACRSMEICETVVRDPDLDQTIYSEFISNVRVQPVSQNMDGPSATPFTHSLHVRALKTLSYPSLHDDLAAVLEMISQYNTHGLRPGPTEHLGFRTFSWIDREREEVLCSDRLAKALASVSSSLEYLQLTVQKWEISLWSTLLQSTSCQNLRALHLHVLEQTNPIPLRFLRTLGQFICQQTKLTNLRLKISKQLCQYVSDLLGKYPNLCSFELDADTELIPSTFLSRHPSLVCVSLRNSARTLPVGKEDVLLVRALQLGHTQRWDYESIRPWFQTSSTGVRRCARGIVHFRMTVETDLEHSALMDIIAPLGATLRCLELEFDRAHFFLSLHKLKALLVSLPRLVELGLILHCQRQPWHEKLDVKDLAYVLDQTAELPYLRALRFSDNEATPLPPFIWQRSFPPKLKYVEWEFGGNSQIYHLERTRMDVWSVEEVSGVKLRVSQASPYTCVDWTSGSLFDHVGGEYRDHKGQQIIDEDLLFQGYNETQ